jgi:VanZ family protein
VNDKDAQTTPPNSGPGLRSWASVGLWLGWALLFAVWTIGLLLPERPTTEQGILSADASFYVSKVAHVSSYAVLACLVYWLSSRWGLRALVWLGLAGHGALTEFLQQFIEGRTGQLSDVGLDLAGILLGLGVGLLLRWLLGKA